MRIVRTQDQALIPSVAVVETCVRRQWQGDLHFWVLESDGGGAATAPLVGNLGCYLVGRMLTLAWPKLV